LKKEDTGAAAVLVEAAAEAGSHHQRAGEAGSSREVGT